MESIEAKETDRFSIWYNHDGVKRAADVHQMAIENRFFYICRIFDGTLVEIEGSGDSQINPNWKLLDGDSSPLAVILGKTIDEHTKI